MNAEVERRAEATPERLEHTWDVWVWACQLGNSRPYVTGTYATKDDAMMARPAHHETQRLALLKISIPQGWMA